MSDIYSFYQLISKYQIEIPIIQRDYAQGRNNSKAADVRKSLVDNMIKAVKEEKSLFFDFVYGRVDNNKFIPFDGQQRLTTLFLFHKYVFEKCQSDSGCNHKDNCSCGGILGRFSYTTRQSSREFCEKLVQEKIISGNSLTDNIKNKSWFYPDWEKDPTVMGMLTMLDEIHCQMRNETDFNTFAEKLTSGCNCPITFHFVDMGEHKMSDETYVKMNARGKTLTPFENFKASLEQYLEGSKKKDLLSCFKDNIDGKWLDLFWDIENKKNKDKKEKVLPDTLMMSFINRHFMNVWRCWYANHSKSEILKENDEFNNRIQKEMPLYPTKDDFVSFDIYKYVIDECGVDTCLSSLFNIWNKLCDPNNTISKDCQAVWNRDNKEKKWDLFEGEKNNNEETYQSKTAFYALLKYYENEKERITLSQWMRIAWNIIENYVEREESYIHTLQLIKSIAEKSFDIISLGDDYNGVAKAQVKEEIDKVKQIETGGSDWKQKIIEAEKYGFFKGAIRFLFTDGDGNINWCDFDTKWSNAKNLFDENGVKDEHKISLTKSLVIQCDNWYGQLYEMQIFNTNAPTWKWILTAKNWITPIHNILLGNEISATKKNTDAKIEQYITPLLEKLPYFEILEKIPDGRFKWYNGLLGLYYNKSDVITFDWENWYRNKILSSLSNISTTQQLKENKDFFLGWDINFVYDGNSKFQWNRDGKIYLLDSSWHRIPKKTEADNKDNNEYYNFPIPSEQMDKMQNNTKNFTDQLDYLINSNKNNR